MHIRETLRSIGSFLEKANGYLGGMVNSAMLSVRVQMENAMQLSDAPKQHERRMKEVRDTAEHEVSHLLVDLALQNPLQGYFISAIHSKTLERLSQLLGKCSPYAAFVQAEYRDASPESSLSAGLSCLASVGIGRDFDETMKDERLWGRELHALHLKQWQKQPVSRAALDALRSFFASPVIQKALPLMSKEMARRRFDGPQCEEHMFAFLRRQGITRESIHAQGEALLQEVQQKIAEIRSEMPRQPVPNPPPARYFDDFPPMGGAD